MEVTAAELGSLVAAGQHAQYPYVKVKPDLRWRPNTSQHVTALAQRLNLRVCDSKACSFIRPIVHSQSLLSVCQLPPS